MSQSVLFRQFPLDHLDTLAPVVAQVYGLNDYDARSKIRKGWGFLEREATEEEAQRIVEAVGDCGGGVLAIDNTAVRAPAEPRVTTGVEFASNGFTLRLQSPKDPTRFLEWAQAEIVSAGQFSEEIIKRASGGDEQKMGAMMVGVGVFLATGIPPGLLGGGNKKKKKEEKPVKSTRTITFARVVTTAGEQFALSPEHFDFSGLGAKKQLNTAANFRVLLGELSGLTSAKVNLGARLLLDNRSLSFANYTGPHDFETELLWLLNATRSASAE
ncbi:MAG TPA: hypothetical protein VNL17_13265 [Verrucomicrobiae bacterium]|nr:hypothetical protein [Verrucomicrobiae bacterium]